MNDVSSYWEWNRLLSLRRSVEVTIVIFSLHLNIYSTLIISIWSIYLEYKVSYCFRTPLQSSFQRLK